MTYRIEFIPRAADATVGLPAAPFSALHKVLVDIARDPWPTTFPDQVIEGVSIRWAPFDRGLGMVVLLVVDQELVRIFDLMWIGT